MLTNRMVNEGLHIDGPGVSIDLIIRAVEGQDYWHREADLEISGLPGVQRLHLSHNGGLVELAFGLRVGINDRPYRQSTAARRVPLCIDATSSYRIERRSY